MWITNAGRIALIWSALLATACASLGPYSSGAVRFDSRENRGLIENEAIREASGLVASHDNSGVLWLHNDSGTPAIYAIDTAGRHLGTFLLQGCTDTDWEDIALQTRPGRDWLYIGAIGDNREVKPVRSICRIAEPTVSVEQPPVTADIPDVEVMAFRYPDGSRDAEALLADPRSGDLYIISKRKNPAGVYRLSFTPTATAPVIAKRVAQLPYTYVTGADISPSGREILVRSYTAIYYWQRLPGETLAETLGREAETAPYTWETGGEAIAWDAAGQGYYTVSEENLGVQARLYFYPRLGDD